MLADDGTWSHSAIVVKYLVACTKILNASACRADFVDVPTALLYKDEAGRVFSLSLIPLRADMPADLAGRVGLVLANLSLEVDADRSEVRRDCSCFAASIAVDVLASLASRSEPPSEVLIRLYYLY